MAVEMVRLRRRPRFLPWLILLIGLIVCAAVIWTIFWRVAAQQTVASLDAWIAREKAFHRNWSCPNRRTTGFPFAIEITCSRPHFDGRVFGRHYSGSLAGFVARAKFTNPNDVTVAVVAPFVIVSDDKTMDIALSWDQLDIVLDGLPQDVAGVSVAGQRLILQTYAQGLRTIDGRAGSASLRLRRDANRPDHAIDFHLMLKDASFAALDKFLGPAAPAEIAADGTITQAGFDPARTLVATVDQWRDAGGHVDLAHLSVTRGETKFQAHGELTVDSTHRLQGRLDTQCIGFEPLLRRLGVDPGLINAGSLLASLLGGHHSDSQSTGPQPLRLPVGFDDGRLSIGPVRTSIRLPQLY